MWVPITDENREPGVERGQRGVLLVEGLADAGENQSENQNSRPVVLGIVVHLLHS